MLLDKLSLTNFRNYTKTSFTFSEGTNLIVGPNASGKTNILEAIYFLASGRSFRVKGTEREAISYGEELARIEGWVVGYELGSEGGGEEKRLKIILTAGEVGGEKTAKKKCLINEIGKRQADFLGNLRAVYFGPEDLELITDSPSLRRKYLDMVLYQVDKEYARASFSYEKGLRSRNRILESMRELGNVDRRRLYFWDQLLIKNGNIITRKRGEYIEYINRLPSTDCELQQFSIEYDRSAISEERLAKYENEEIAAGVTLVGPHRDDFRIKIAGENRGNMENKENWGRDLSIYGSRGEQRLAILWLKLKEMSFIKEKTGELPLLLLDDIFSELDMEHRKLVFNLMGNQQTMMTTADLGMVERKWLEGVKIIELESN